MSPSAVSTTGSSPSKPATSTSSSPSLYSCLILVDNLPYEPQPKPKPKPKPAPFLRIRIRSTSSRAVSYLFSSPSPPNPPSHPASPTYPSSPTTTMWRASLPWTTLWAPVVGEMLDEDVEPDGGKYRRRLRFKRMPNLRLSRNGNGKRNGIEPVPVPEQFLCPISSEIMKDPVVLASGQTNDRPFIQEWLNSGNRTCPQTYDRPFIQENIWEPNLRENSILPWELVSTPKTRYARNFFRRTISSRLRELEHHN